MSGSCRSRADDMSCCKVSKMTAHTHQYHLSSFCMHLNSIPIGFRMHPNRIRISRVASTGSKSTLLSGIAKVWLDVKGCESKTTCSLLVSAVRVSGWAWLGLAVVAAWICMCVCDRPRSGLYVWVGIRYVYCAQCKDYVCV